ncbi:AAA family ATPase [Streptomyces sp. SID2888]|nr:AAA family ATPase [Streptomyces sp. SID2888]
MSLSRQSRTTPTGESDTPYPVDLGPLQQEALTPDLLAALEALSAALTATRSANPTPLAGALSRLTEADVEHSLNSTPVQWRRNLLSTLRIPIDGTRVNRALCHDVLTRIQRDPEAPRAQQAARHLAHPVFHDLALAFVHSNGVAEDASRPLTHRWSPALLRLTAWAQLGASVGSARIWSWALVQPWMTDTGVSVEGVLEAAQLVVDLAPDAAAEEEEGEDMPDEAEGPPQVEVELVAEGPDSDRLGAALQSVKEALEAAAEPARRTAAAIAAEARPDDADLSALRSVAEAFDAAAHGLRAHGAQPAKADLAHVQKETDAALNRLSAAPLRERLAQVARLACRHDDAALDQDLVTARERARAIRDGSEWEAADLEDAEALDALLTMVELHADEHDPAEILALLPIAVKSRWLAYPAGNYTQLLFRPADEEPVEATVQGAESVPAEPSPEALPTKAATAAPLPRPTRGSTKKSTGDHDEGRHPATSADETASTVSATVPEPRAAEEPPAVNAPVVPPTEGEPAAGAVEPEPEPDPVPPAPEPSASPAPAASPHLEHPGRSAENRPSESHKSLAKLISAERYGLAASLAAGLGEPSHRITALQLAACAEAVRSASSESATRMRTLLAGPDFEELTASRPDAALTTAALLRTVLVTGDPEAGASLSRVASGLPPSLAQVAEEVAQRALKSLLLHSPPLALARDTAELERALEDAREDCKQALDQVPSIRYSRAHKIARRWWNPQKGLIGSLLRHAVDDDRSGLDVLSRTVRELRDPAVIQSQLDKIDREFMSPGARSRLDGPARQDLLRHTADRLALVDRWIRQAQELGARDTNWSADQVQEMRALVLGLREDVLRDVLEQAVTGDGVAAATMEATATALARTFALLSGEAQLENTELTTELALHSELLKVPGAVIDAATGGITAPDVPAAELARAGDRSWEDAVRIQVSNEHFATAQKLLDLWTKRQLPDLGEHTALPEKLQSLVLDSGKQVAHELRDTRQRLEENLRRARVDGALTEERERTFERQVQDAVPAPDGDLARVRRDLETLSGELNRAHANHAAALLTRLNEIDGLHAEDRRRVEQLISAHDLLTADELISHLVNGESIPDTQATDRSLAAFFPDVPNALPGMGISGELINAVRQRRCFEDLEALDYSALSPEIAEQTAQGLAGWADLASRKGSLRTQGVRESEMLMPALRLIGYSSKKGPQRIEKPRSGSYRFLDVPAIEYTGSALVPAFGSGLRGSLRVMLVWDRPSAETLMSWIQQDPNDDSLLVAYFGTLSVRDRRALAAQSAGGRRAIVVLDDSALAHLAACGNQRLDSAMRVLLPFSAVNPYVMGKRAPVSEEMFFGRRDELTSVQRATGDQVVFGGRGLGKSALLKEAGRKYEAQIPDSRFNLLLSLDSTFTGTNAPSSTVWDRIGRRLLEREALALPRRVKADSALTYQHVLDGIKAWLREDTKRGLLIMLDEADGFFESDSPQFTETRRLRDLGAETEDRVKVVFAGLHSVQRYAKIAVNSPFSHLAQRPTVIGPLRPQDAVNLLIAPLAVLGYEFEEPALVHRILGHCSYQPFLLQMFGHRLVQTMHSKRSGTSSGPPYTITRADVEAVQSDRDLRVSITEAFHDTLRLDSRYNVIANVVAHHAHHYGLDARLSQVQLREECTYWWPKGFDNLDTDQFRAYLSEMEGLGVLAPDPDHRGWHLRSANALSMIGNLGMVEAELEQASSRRVAEDFSKFEARHRSRDGHSHSPLTADQIADVLPGHGNQARLIIGTIATGIDRVSAALRDVADTTGWEMPQVSKRSDFDRELMGGKAGQQRVVVSDLTVKSPGEEACHETIAMALDRTPVGSGVTRSAVVIAGPDQRSLWSLALAGGQGDGLEIEALPLRRYTLDGLRSWAQEQEGVPFSSESQLQDLQDTTGGWPLLVDRLAATLKLEPNGGNALRQATASLDSGDGANEFLRQAGLTSKTPQWVAYRAVLVFMTDDGMIIDDLRAAIEADTDGDQVDAADALRNLRAMQVFDVDTAGKHRLEPVLHTCWNRVHAG